MTANGPILLIGADDALAADLTKSLSAAGAKVSAAPDVRSAAMKLAGESVAVVIANFAKIPPSDRELLERVHRDRGGFTLIGIEEGVSLSPATPSPLRRVPWPLPKGFLDQVRASDVPVAFLVEPTLFLTKGMQNALGLAGIQFFQLEDSSGIANMLREQAARADAVRDQPKTTGFWERLSGTGEESPGKVSLGRVAVGNFSGTHTEAGHLDEVIRKAVPRTSCYLVSTGDPLRGAIDAVAAGKQASVPREMVGQIVTILFPPPEAPKTLPREKERVLVVDNEVPTLSRLAEALLALGYEVSTTTQGEEALKMAKQKPFALAAIGGSALETTRLTGANLALKLRENDKDIRIILMIDQHPAQEALKGVSRAVDLGLDDAILKPIDVSRLALSIKRALERRFLTLENIRLFQVVQENERKLAAVNGFQTKFFATVAHDVKNPLTAILGYSEVLGMRLTALPNELKCANHIHNAAKTLNLLISDLVDLAAIESGKLRVEIGELDLAQVISDVRSRVDLVAQKKSLALTVNQPPSFPALNGDAHRIGQVIQNLCTNAVQYTKEGGKITIEVIPNTPKEGFIRVGVRDTGIGISKEDLPRVWERFFQTKEAQTMRKAGFGLGLKIAREIVLMHGGEMGIESELGVGSFFYFQLPVPKGAAQIPVKAAVAAPPQAAPTGAPEPTLVARPPTAPPPTGLPPATLPPRPILPPAPVAAPRPTLPPAPAPIPAPAMPVLPPAPRPIPPPMPVLKPPPPPADLPPGADFYQPPPGSPPKS